MYEALTKREEQRWNEMVITPARKPGLMADARRILAHKSTYEAVEAKLRSMGMYCPWWFIGLAHLREADLDFTKQLAQGDPLNQPSRNDPAHRGPFLGPDAFLRGCLDALIDCGPHAAHWTDWSPGGTAVISDLYNGLGYAAKGLPSPYAWGGTNQYVRGKYIRDHVYSPTFVDPQPGVMAVLKCLMGLDQTVRFGGPAVTAPQAPVSPAYPQAPKDTQSAGPLSGLLSVLAGLFNRKAKP